MGLFARQQHLSATRTTVIVLLLTLVHLEAVHAGLNLNFRSQQLSNIFGGKQSPPPQQEKSNRKKESPDLLRLDLSGRLQILLAASQGEEEPTTARVIEPLFPLTTVNKSMNPFTPKKVKFSIDYDFARSLWGIFRMVPEAVWDVPSGAEEDALYRPRQVDLALEQGVAPCIENALETRLWWKHPWLRVNASTPPPPSSPVLRLRCENTGYASVSCGLPLHPRVSYQGIISKNVWGPPRALSVPEPTTMQQDWWLPDICINALGALQAHNQVWMGRANSIPRLGFRLSVRKQLEWSILNSPVEQDSKTHISLQVDGAASQWKTGIRLESTLDEPLARARVAVSTHWHLSRGPTGEKSD